MSLGSSRVRWYSLLSVIAIAAAWGIFTTYRDTPEDRVYRIGWEEDPPVQVARASGEPTGLAVEIIREAARRKGIRLEWVHRSDSSEAALRSKAVDLWPLMTITEDRKQFLHLTDPYQDNAHIFLVAATSPARKGEDLAESVISYDRIPFNERLIRQHFPRARLLSLPSIRAAIDALCRGESQAVFLDKNAGFTILLEGSPCPDRPLRVVSNLRIETQLALGSTFESRAAADAIREEIGVMADEGLLARMIPEWSYASSHDLAAISTLMNARHRMQQYRVGFAGLALLFIFTVWSAIGYRRERNRAQVSSRALHAAERCKSMIT